MVEFEASARLPPADTTQQQLSTAGAVEKTFCLQPSGLAYKAAEELLHRRQVAMQKSSGGGQPTAVFGSGSAGSSEAEAAAVAQAALAVVAKPSGKADVGSVAAPISPLALDNAVPDVGTRS